MRRRHIAEEYQSKIATQRGQVRSTILGICIPEIVVREYKWAIQ